jgi:hypothetical protein
VTQRPRQLEHVGALVRLLGRETEHIPRRTTLFKPQRDRRANMRRVDFVFVQKDWGYVGVRKQTGWSRFRSPPLNLDTQKYIRLRNVLGDSKIKIKHSASTLQIAG